MKQYLKVKGVKQEIRADYRIVLAILRVLTAKDRSMLPQARVRAALKLFYVDFDRLSDYGEAYRVLCEFLDFGGKGEGLQLLDFEKDLRHIQAAVNVKAGGPTRNMEFLHIEDYVGYLQERDPESTISHIINIRYALQKGKFAKLPKELQEFYMAHREEIDLEPVEQTPEKVLSDAEKQAAIDDWQAYLQQKRR